MKAKRKPSCMGVVVLSVCMCLLSEYYICIYWHVQIWHVYDQHHFKSYSFSLVLLLTISSNLNNRIYEQPGFRQDKKQIIQSY